DGEPAVDPGCLVHRIQVGGGYPEDGGEPLDENVPLSDRDEGAIDLHRRDVPARHDQLPAAVEYVPPRRLVFASLPGELLGLLGDGGALGDLDEPQPQHQDPEHGHEREPDDGESNAVFHSSPRTLPLINRFIKGATTKLRTRFERGTKISRLARPVLISPP